MLRTPTAAIPSLLGDAYRDASIAGLDMHRIVDLLEPVRGAATADDSYLGERALDAAAGRAAGSPSYPVVDRLRSRYLAAVAADFHAVVAELAAADERSARAVWLGACASVLSIYRPTLLTHLTAVPPPGSEADPQVQRVRESVSDVLLGRWDRALPAVEGLLPLTGAPPPERARLLALAAMIRVYWRYDADAAQDLLDRAEQVCPTEPRVWEGIGRVRFLRRDFDAAADAYRRATELDPGYDGGYQGLSDCAVARGDTTEAERILLRAGADIPDSGDLRLYLLRLYAAPALFAEREDALGRLAEETVAVAPIGDYDVKTLLGNAYRDNGKPDLARTYYREAIALRPTRSTAYEELGYLESGAGEADAAAELFARAAEIDPAEWTSRFGLVLVHRARGDYDDAVEQLRVAIAVSNGLYDWTLRPYLIDLLLEADRLDDALAEARSCLADAVPTTDLRPALVQVATRLWADRREDAEALLAESGVDAAAREALRGEVAAAALDADTAVAAYRRASELDPDRSEYGWTLGRLLTDQQDWAGARAAIEAAYGTDHDDDAWNRALARLENERGNELFGEGGYDEAATAYECAARHQPTDPVYFSNLALAREYSAVLSHRAESYRLAAKALDAAIDVGGTDPDYAARREHLRTLLETVDRFGELMLRPAAVDPIRVLVSADLAPSVDPKRDGPDFLPVRIPALRERVRAATGVTIPGIRLVEDSLLPSGEFRVEINGVTTAHGTAPLDEPDASTLLAQLETVLRQNVWQFLSFDELDDLIVGGFEAIDGEAPVARARLGLAAILRALARDGVPMTDVSAVLRAVGPGVIRADDMPAALERARRAAAPPGFASPGFASPAAASPDGEGDQP
ncbi:Tetratricopeptide repeat-containing protein [Cryptosporangium aurantiacum]|uniref:Tetratricopeptide repeat-containing protein n=2 Tax=Cryptosporangium aurantiacum TaxID=134849 RepID=A0A1M7KUY8_9ACTN|nr:Tetratricopeptide repeat-containing protein [Cryptosporangium aurantiacum]